MYISIRAKGVVGAWALMCTALTPLAHATPSVSGVSGILSTGQTVTLNGSGFGSKPQPQPVLWDNFEGGTNGQNVQGAPATIGQWDTGAGSQYVTYTNAKSHTGRMSSAHDFVTRTNASLAKNMTFTRLYMDFWIVAAYIDNKSLSFKPWRFYGENDDYQLDFVWSCDGNLMNRVQATAGLSIGSWGGPGYTNDVWTHIQLIYNESSPNTANGTIRNYVDSQVAGLDSGAIMTEMAPAHFDQIRIGHYWGKDAVVNCPSNSGARVNVDDVYIDTSWARVELGNAPTYTASTHREIQVAKTWTDGSVSVTFNPGTFAADSTAYLFVTDANNSTSAGIPVKIGGTAVAPQPPTSVSVH